MGINYCQREIRSKQISCDFFVIDLFVNVQEFVFYNEELKILFFVSLKELHYTSIHFNKIYLSCTIDGKNLESLQNSTAYTIDS